MHTIPPRSQFQLTASTFANVAAALHRFEELIAGHRYLIEVSPVSDQRFRAHIVRIPGVPTALMPFYGSTPNEAAQSLCNWLTRAHARAAMNTAPPL